MFYLKFGNEIKLVSKISKNEFTQSHIDYICNMKLDKRSLIFPNNKWKSVLLGSGEEKAVYCVCDHNDKVFALELIDENHYLNGRLINGDYFLNTFVDNIKNIKLNIDSLIGLKFTGLVKAREFIYGYEWDKFLFDPCLPNKLFDNMITLYLQTSLLNDYREFNKYYKDAHGRNIMFEICHKSIKFPSVVMKNYNNGVECNTIKLRAIDVR